MKAAVYARYGNSDVLKVKEVIKPMLKDYDMLVRIHATAVNSGDVRLRKADPFAVRFIFGLFKPRITILGSVFSGVVESTGSQVTKFKSGDLVFGHTDMRFGAYAEYICIPESGSVAQKPATLSHEEAAAIPFGGVTALHFIKKAGIRKGQKVLVAGASGAVGSAAVQLAKSNGAIVTGVCSSSNVEMVRSLGADKVIDYTKDDFTRQSETYDLIYDAVNAISVGSALQSLARDGKMILSAAELPDMIRGFWISKTSKRKVITGVISHSAEDIHLLKTLVDAGKYRPVIDKTYSLEQIAEAHAYVEKGHKKGNVIVTL